MGNYERDRRKDHAFGIPPRRVCKAGDQRPRLHSRDAVLHVGKRTTACRGPPPSARDCARFLKPPITTGNRAERPEYEQAGTGTRLAASAAMKPTEIIPVAREELNVGKRTVEASRVVVRKTVSQEEQKVEVPLTHDEVDVERVAIDRVVEEPPAQRYEGDVLVIPVMEEVVVVKTQWVLKEELRVRKRAVRTVHEETVALRAEHAAVDRTKAKP